MTPIPSATIVVLCPRSAKQGEQRIQYDTLMVQRSARDGSSFRSAVVFPGGALDLADEEAIDAAYASAQSASASSEPASKSVEGYLLSLKLCALREAFEETGLLLLPSTQRQSAGGPPICRAIGPKEANFSADEWNSIREEVHNDAVHFVPFLKRVSTALGLSSTDSNVLPPLAPMAHHSNWITPRAVVRPAKRFDAHFFVTVLDTADQFGSDTQSLNLSADGSETLSLRLGTPGEIMLAGMNDEISLFPPQFYILADLEQALSRGGPEPLSHIQPLIFGKGPGKYSQTAELRVTPVEEEYPDERKAKFSWDRKPQQVTSIEPRAFPKLGAMVSVRKDQDAPFVFPLILPGDWQASPSQRERARVAMAPAEDDVADAPVTNSQGQDTQVFNRLYVSPRPHADGGGMTVRGCLRRGIGSLPDFEFGVTHNQVEEAKARL